MHTAKDNFSVEVIRTDKHCPAGEKAGERYIKEGKIPVLSCEGACIRGEIARLAAHMVAKEEPYRRGCHGELLTVPGSALAKWMTSTGKVVLIDGCFLHCHGRMLGNLVGKDKLAVFDALSYYRKYSESFDIDEVPEAARKAAARQVADAVLAELGKTATREAPAETGRGEVVASDKAAGCGCS